MKLPVYSRLSKLVDSLIDAFRQPGMGAAITNLHFYSDSSSHLLFPPLKMMSVVVLVVVVVGCGTFVVDVAKCSKKIVRCRGALRILSCVRCV